jgi:hypothetical protein
MGPPPGIRRFHVADLSPQGDVLLEADYGYEQLERLPFAWDAIVRCATSLWRSPDEFELSFSAGEGPGGILPLRWRNCATGAGILTIRSNGGIASLSLLASGIDPDGDRITLGAFQSHLVHALHDTGTEPAFSLMTLSHRPLLATVLLLPPQTDSARLAAAVLDRCFAAAFFRYHGLV